MAKNINRKFRRVKIGFHVMGFVDQEVIITDTKITPKELQKLLDSGHVCTTIQEGGTVEFIVSGKVIGRVESVDNQCEYTDYTVDGRVK